MERHPVELIEPLKPLIAAVGCSEVLEKFMRSLWLPKFGLTFTDQYREPIRPITKESGFKTPLPNISLWINKYTKTLPSVILDYHPFHHQGSVGASTYTQHQQPTLEDLLAAGQGALKGSGVKYYVLLGIEQVERKGEATLAIKKLSHDNRTQILPLPLYDESELLAELEKYAKTIEQASVSYYKEKAKKTRKRANSKVSSFPAAGDQQFWAPLVRYNFKAAIFDDLAKDQPSAIKSFHVAYSALVEQAKQFEDDGKVNFISATRWVGDALCVKIALGLGRTGMLKDAEEYLSNHLKWFSVSFDVASAAYHRWVAKNYAGIADGLLPMAISQYSGHVEPGYFYLMAILHLDEINELKEVYFHDFQVFLTKAFDAYKNTGKMRMLMFISFLSAYIFDNNQNIELLARKLKDDGWGSFLSKCLLQKIPISQLSYPSRWYLASTTSPNLELIDIFDNLSPSLNLPQKIRFSHEKDCTNLFYCAFIFAQKSLINGFGSCKVPVVIALSNMSPNVIQFKTATLNFVFASNLITGSALSQFSVAVELPETSELVPGAFLHHTASIDIPQNAFPALSPSASNTPVTLKLTSIELADLGSPLELIFDHSALSTHVSLANSEWSSWNRPFFRSLQWSFWERSQSIQIINAKPELAFSLESQSTLAIGALIKLRISLRKQPDALEINQPIDAQIVTSDIDGGIFGEKRNLNKVILLDLSTTEWEDYILVSWDQPGLKTLRFQISSRFVGSQNTLSTWHTFNLDVVAPVAFEYHLLPIPTPYALNPFAGNHPTALLNYAVFVDVKISIAEELRLVKWEFWDSISGHQFLSLIQPSTAKSYKSGDVIRAGFHVDATKCCEGQIEPIFRLHWSTATTLGSINHPIPVLMPIPQCLFVIPSVKETKKLVRVGECFECQWTIWNLGPTAQNAAITISTSSSSFPSPSHSSASDSHHTTSPLIYMGPKHHEFFLEAGTCKLVRGHLIATIQGFIPFPNAMVHAVQPGETLTFESLKHADILVLLNK